ncbi:MAG: long-chain-acyl-CoA synthetase [Acidobacteriaceae bacterium]
MTQVLHDKVTQNGSSSALPWLRALELTKPIASNPTRIFPAVLDEVAALHPNNPALLSDREDFTYRELTHRANQYARWTLDQGIARGEVVCLLMTNRPEYMAIWLGITSTGAVVSLLNTQLAGPSLAHCIRVVSPKHIIAAIECMDRLNTALPLLDSPPKLWVHGAETPAHPSIDRELTRHSTKSLTPHERRETLIDDLALYIYTSGTTGLPKAGRITHARVLQWTHWFAGMMQAVPSDRMYNCLPMYHSVGGVQAPGSVLVAAGSVVLRERFSAREFWSDIHRWDCTLFQYIGELCRYLLHAPSSTLEIQHRLRLACGNGLAPEIWDTFKNRFHIPQILEFYAATEGNISLFNVEGKRGSIGHIPGFLAHRFSPALVQFDVERGAPVRDDRGFCILCESNQTGEALGKLSDDSTIVGRRFDGYASAEDTEKKILHDVFEPGDSWIRSGDLMRKDEQGFFYFVDRVGDTFRRKGENVATSEVSAAISEFPGILHANVYGVVIPGADGRAGMAALVTASDLNLVELREHLTNRLPSYARPLFLRMRTTADVTGTFKYSTTELARQGYDPDSVVDPLYFNFDELNQFVPLDKNLYQRIQAGEIRL